MYWDFQARFARDPVFLLHIVTGDNDDTWICGSDSETKQQLS